MRLRFFRTPFALELNGQRISSTWAEGDDGVKSIECLGGGVIHIEFDEATRREPLVITNSGWGLAGEVRSEPLSMPRKVSGKR
jgi:phosphoglycerate dehydrogenase-like enzyme